MMNRFPLIVLIAAIAASAASAQKVNPRLLSTYSAGPHDGYSWRQREIAYPADPIRLTKQLLLSTLWTPGGTLSAAILVFFADDIFKFGSVQSGVSIIGHYHVGNNGTVELSIEQRRNDWGARFSPFRGRHTTLVFRRGLSNLWYSDGLVQEDSGFTFYAVGSEQKTGTETVLDGVRVERTRKRMVVVRRAEFHSAPTATSSALEVVYLDGAPTIEVPAFLKGTILTVLARTTGSSPAEGTARTWCFVEWVPFETPHFGWVEDGSLANVDPAKMESYRLILREELRAAASH